MKRNKRKPFLSRVVIQGGMAWLALTCAAKAGPLSDSFATLVKTNGGTISWEADGGNSAAPLIEELRGVTIEMPDGQRVRTAQTILEGSPESPNVRMQDVVLSGPKGQGGARSIEVTGDVLGPFIRQSARPNAADPVAILRGLAAANGSLAAEGIWLTASRNDGSRPEELLVEKLEATLSSAGADSLLVEDANSTSGTGEGLAVKRIVVAADFAKILPLPGTPAPDGISDRIGDILRNGLTVDYTVEMNQALISDKDHNPVVRLGKIKLQRDSEEGPAADVFEAAMARAATIPRPEARGLAAYNAMVGLNMKTSIEVSGFWLPWGDLVTGQFGEVVKAAGDRVLSGGGHVTSSIRQGKLDIDGSMDLEGAADVSLNLTLGLPPIAASRVEELVNGASVGIGDIPPITIERFSVAYQDKGLDRVAKGFGLKGSGAAVSEALTAAVDRLVGIPLVAVQARSAFKGIGDWIDSGLEKRSCVSMNAKEGTGMAPTVVEVGMISMLSVEAAAQKIGLAYYDCP